MPRSSSSSSDEEEDRRIKQLREIAVSFDSLNQNKDEKPSSKRHQKSEEDPNAFEVTPEFQEFVAKKLRKKLDE
ncbi:hypothetical protein BpHYR1_051205 [Brachionus plicatilis]|uniref:Uncharacterized protein n=1 Tax=Brachionus plicatilis TaxID=10195 RepID=A0A3M7S476_BRAPC|nr:hypothetical protein BpHYR1_051205 [Brachionus plicatilis]